MKITVTLNAGLNIDDLNLKGLNYSESQKNWDNDKKCSHGRQRENKATLENIAGSAKANFDMNINFDLQPEELQSCYSCIQELVKTVADSHHQTAEAVEKTAEAVNKADLTSKEGEFCFPENEVIEKIARDFCEVSRKARDTENITDLEQAIYVGNILYNAFDDFGYNNQSHRGMLADIRGTLDVLRELKAKKRKEEKEATAK